MFNALRYYIYLGLGLMTVWFVVEFASSWRYFIDIPSFLILFPVVYVVTLMSYGWKSGFRYLKLPLDAEVATIKELRQGVLFYNLLQKNTWYVAFIGFLIGLMFILQALKDPSSIAPKISIASLVPLYAVIFISLFIIPRRAILEHRLLEREEAAKQKEQ